MLRGTTLVACRLSRKATQFAVTGVPVDGWPRWFTAAAHRRVQRLCCRLAPPPARCSAPTAPDRCVSSLVWSRIICGSGAGAARL